MADLLLALNGRFEVGETLQVAGTIWESVSALRWEARGPDGQIVVVAQGSTAYTIPLAAEGWSYRVTTEYAGQSFTTEWSAPVVVDSKLLHAPVLSGWDNLLVSLPQEGPLHMEGVFARATFSDADRQIYAGAVLEVSNTNALEAGGDGQDMLGIVSFASGNTFFVYDQTTGDIWWSTGGEKSRVIAEVDPSLAGAGTDLRITFTRNADAASINALIDAISVSNIDSTPEEDRMLTLSITDPSGACAQIARYVGMLAPVEPELLPPEPVSGIVIIEEPIDAPVIIIGVSSAIEAT